MCWQRHLYTDDDSWHIGQRLNMHVQRRIPSCTDSQRQYRLWKRSGTHARMHTPTHTHISCVDNCGLSPLDSCTSMLLLSTVQNLHVYSRPDLAPGATCTHADNNLECVSNATCRNSSDEAVNSTMKCTCDNGFHEDHSACIPGNGLSESTACWGRKESGEGVWVGGMLGKVC